MFAKLYEPTKGEQILVMLQEDEEGNPEIRFYFEPEGLGVCSSAHVFKRKKKGISDAESAFNEVTEQMAIEVRDNALEFIRENGLEL